MFDAYFSRLVLSRCGFVVTNKDAYKTYSDPPTYFQGVESSNPLEFTYSRGQKTSLIQLTESH